MKDAIRKVIEDIRFKEKQLWKSDKSHAMGTFAIALMLDGYAGRLEVAIGDMPGPKVTTPSTSIPQPERKKK